MVCFFVSVSSFYCHLYVFVIISIFDTKEVATTYLFYQRVLPTAKQSAYPSDMCWYCAQMNVIRMMRYLL